MPLLCVSPHTAMIASPMNFCSVPLCCSTLPTMSEKYSLSCATSLSASALSVIVVKPRMSENKTVTGCLRPFKASTKERRSFENGLGDIFGNITVQHVAITPPLQLLQRVFKNNPKGAGGDEAKQAAASSARPDCDPLKAIWRTTSNAIVAPASKSPLSSACGIPRQMIRASATIAAERTRSKLLEGSVKPASCKTAAIICA